MVIVERETGLTSLSPRFNISYALTDVRAQSWFNQQATESRKSTRPFGFVTIK